MDLARKTRGQLDALEISHLYDKLSSEISGGQMKLLQLANALAGDPKMLLLDEPTAGVAPRLAQDIFDSIEKQCQAKRVLLFSSSSIGFKCSSNMSNKFS